MKKLNVLNHSMLETIIILLTIVLAVYFLFRPTSKKEKDRFEDKDNWRGGF